MGGNLIDGDLEFMKTLVLVGRTGNGKSATGNSILRKKAFKSISSRNGVTSTCEQQMTVLPDGQILSVIDTPGLYDFSVKSEITEEELVKCVNMAKNGIHAALLVLSVRVRFSREEEAAIQSLRNFFGSKINDYMIVVFTGGDDLEENDEILEDYLGSNCPEPLKKILNICENRYVLFNNRTTDEKKKAEQVQMLLSLVDKVLAKNGNKPYTKDISIEMKTGALKLNDQTTKVLSLEGYYPEDKTSKLMEQLQKSNEYQIQLSTEIMESKLRETTYRLEQQMAEEKAAEIRLLRKNLEKAKKENVELRKRAERCVIL